MVAHRHGTARDGGRNLDDFLCLLFLVHVRLAAMGAGFDFLARSGNSRRPDHGPADGIHAPTGFAGSPSIPRHIWQTTRLGRTGGHLLGTPNLRCDDGSTLCAACGFTCKKGDRQWLNSCLPPESSAAIPPLMAEAGASTNWNLPTPRKSESEIWKWVACS